MFGACWDRARSAARPAPTCNKPWPSCWRPAIGRRPARLKAIHRLVHEEVDVIPLWQLVEHLAHSSSVAGIGERPVTLYDHVEKWQLELKAPSQ